MSPFQAAVIDSLKIILATLGGIIVLITTVILVAMLLKEGAMAMYWKSKFTKEKRERESLERSLKFHMDKLNSARSDYAAFSTSFRKELEDYEALVTQCAKDVASIYCMSQKEGWHFDKRKVALRLFHKLVPSSKSLESSELAFGISVCGADFEIDEGRIPDILK